MAESPGFDFHNYELTPELNVHNLAGDLLPKIAEAAGFELTPEPQADNLGALIGKVGPDKELQNNISVVREALGEDARGKISDWIERSGVMFPVERGFKDNREIPEPADAIVWTGGVANWMLRRAFHTLRQPLSNSQTVVAVGEREMKPAEHPLVGQFERQYEHVPTETQFVTRYLKNVMKDAGHWVRVIPVEEKQGDKIMDGLFLEYPGLLDKRVLVVSNAPNAIQSAGELRLAARRVDPDFDSDGEQVFMTSDSFPLARNGEPAKTHQNPETALGQLVRNALYLERNRS